MLRREELRRRRPAGARPTSTSPRSAPGLLDVTGRLFDVEYVEVADAHALARGRGVVRRGARRRRGSAGSTSTCTRGPGSTVTPRSSTSRRASPDGSSPEGVLVCNFSRGADGARPRRHAVPRVRSPGAPRARRRPRVGAVLRRRHRVGLRRGAVADARGVGVGRRRAAVVRDRTPTASRSRASWSRRCARPRSFGKGLYARTQMFYAALSYTLHQDVPDDITATMRELQATYDVFGLRPGHPLLRVVRAPRGLRLGLLHLHVEPGDRQGPVLRVRPATTCSPPRWRTATATGCWPPGGSRDAADLVEDFLGRPYDFTAFERWLDRADPSLRLGDTPADERRVGDGSAGVSGAAAGRSRRRR